MNSPIPTPGVSQSGATSSYTVLQPLSEESAALIPGHKSLSPWKKFVHTSTQQPASEFDVTVIPAPKTATGGPTVLKPAPLPEDYEARLEAFLNFLDYLESKPEMADNVNPEQ
jgi:hypothetical protein